MGSIEALLGVWAAGLTLMVLGLPKPEKTYIIRYEFLM